MPLTRVTSVVCVVAIAGTVGVTLMAQRGAVAQKKLPAGAVAKAEAAIDKAAAEKHLTLSPSAKQALATEVIRQEAAKPTPDVDAATSSAKVDQLLAPLATLPANGAMISPQAATTLVVEDKKKQVASTLGDDIARHAKARGKTLDEPVRLQMLQDLTKQSDALSKSGLPVELIRARNDATLTAIDREVGNQPLTPQTYQKAMADLFTKQVLMDIASTPDGASVAVEGVNLGKTNITGKPFEPGKSYTFTFTLAGYEAATRSFYVPLGIDTDSLTEPLTATPSDGSDLKVETKDEVESTHTSTLSTAVVLLTLGVIMLIGLGVTVARRRR